MNASPTLYRPPLAAVTSHVGAWNRATSWFDAPLPLADSAVALVEAGDAPLPERFGFLAEIAPGVRILAVPTVVPFEALTGTALDVEDLPYLPAALCNALLEGIGASLLALLPVSDRAARLVGQGRWPDLAPEMTRLVWFHATLSGWEGGTGALDLGLEPSALARALGDSAIPARHPLWPGLATRLTQTLHESLGRIDLPLAVLRDLAPGGILLLPAGVEPERRRRLRGETIALDLVREGPDWLCAVISLDGAPPPRIPRRPNHLTHEDAMDEVAPDRPGLHLPADLPVAVDLDLGRVTASLAEIESWQVGRIVPLDATDPAAGVEVVLRVSGRVIGAGDLVRLDDRLGVRLARLALD